ncbi:MAG: hypothetical protein Kow0069_05170 [Promethearchaeota archaeon]
MRASNQLSAITDELGQDVDEVLGLLEPFGVTHVELRTVWGKNVALLDDGEVDRLKASLDAHGMGVSVVAGPVFKCFLPWSRLATTRKPNFTRNPTYNASLVDRVLEVADALDSDRVRAFSFFKGLARRDREREWNYLVDQVTRYVDAAKARGKTVVLENEGVCLVDTIEACLRLADDVGDDHLKFVCDPGNFFMAGHNYSPDEYEALVPHTGHMHVKDPKRKLPFAAVFGVVGEGKVDYRGIFQKYQEAGYRGFYSLETHSPRRAKRRAVSLESLKNIAAMLAEVAVGPRD